MEKVEFLNDKASYISKNSDIVIVDNMTENITMYMPPANNNVGKKITVIKNDFTSNTVTLAADIGAQYIASTALSFVVNFSATAGANSGTNAIDLNTSAVDTTGYYDGEEILITYGTARGDIAVGDTKIVTISHHLGRTTLSGGVLPSDAQDMAYIKETLTPDEIPTTANSDTVKIAGYVSATTDILIGAQFNKGDVIFVSGTTNNDGRYTISKIREMDDETSRIYFDHSQSVTAESAGGSFKLFTEAINQTPSITLNNVTKIVELVSDGDTWILMNEEKLDSIKILPSDFMTNDGSANKPLHYDDTTTAGLRVTTTSALLIATVSIPLGYKATAVTVYSDVNIAVDVYEADINNRTISSSLTSGVCNTEINITDVTATTTNYLVIKVTTTAGTDRVSGGIVDIERV